MTSAESAAGAYRQLLADLRAEREVLNHLLATLPDDKWDADSPAEGWTLRDCVVHLCETDEGATTIASRDAPDARETPREPLQRGHGGSPSSQDEQRSRRGQGSGVLTAGMLRAKALTGDQLRAWYRAAGERMLHALAQYGGEERLPWAGRAMGVRSYTSARLMEHWSHGLDIHDAAGVAAVDTDRLRHIAHLGFITRDFAYRTHGLEPPPTPLYVELTSPSGETWRWGPPDAPDHIDGPAGDWCRVVTQRIHPDDTSLRCQGPHAREFLGIAQAFAGPPGKGRAPKGLSPA
jgi:uncharacterized protein (TIGR03084 family)